MNKTTLGGRIATVAQSHETTNSVVTKFLLITEERVSGETKTEKHNIVAWGKSLNTLFTQHYLKGDYVEFVGKGQTRTYTDKDGVEREVHEIILNQHTDVQRVHQAQANRRAGSEG